MQQVEDTGIQFVLEDPVLPVALPVEVQGLLQPLRTLQAREGGEGLAYAETDPGADRGLIRHLEAERLASLPHTVLDPQQGIHQGSIQVEADEALGLR